MPNVVVVKRGNKFAVLVNYIQVGINYSTEKQAQKEAAAIKERKTW